MLHNLNCMWDKVIQIFITFQPTSFQSMCCHAAISCTNDTFNFYFTFNTQITTFICNHIEKIYIIIQLNKKHNCKIMKRSEKNPSKCTSPRNYVLLLHTERKKILRHCALYMILYASNKISILINVKYRSFCNNIQINDFSRQCFSQQKLGL